MAAGLVAPRDPPVAVVPTTRARGVGEVAAGPVRSVATATAAGAPTTAIVVTRAPVRACAAAGAPLVAVVATPGAARRPSECLSPAVVLPGAHCAVARIVGTCVATGQVDCRPVVRDAATTLACHDTKQPGLAVEHAPSLAACGALLVGCQLPPAAVPSCFTVNLVCSPRAEFPLRQALVAPVGLLRPVASAAGIASVFACVFVATVGCIVARLPHCAGTGMCGVSVCVVGCCYCVLSRVACAPGPSRYGVSGIASRLAAVCESCAHVVLPVEPRAVHVSSAVVPAPSRSRLVNVRRVGASVDPGCELCGRIVCAAMLLVCCCEVFAAPGRCAA